MPILQQWRPVALPRDGRHDILYRLQRVNNIVRDLADFHKGDPASTLGRPPPSKDFVAPILARWQHRSVRGAELHGTASLLGAGRAGKRQRPDRGNIAVAVGVEPGRAAAAPGIDARVSSPAASESVGVARRPVVSKAGEMVMSVALGRPSVVAAAAVAGAGQADMQSQLRELGALLKAAEQQAVTAATAQCVLDRDTARANPAPAPVATPAPAAVPPPAARQGLQGLKTPSLADAMAFSGPAPELVNARLAMLGFAGAFGAEFTSHVCLVEQFESAAVPVLVTVLLVIAGTFAPILFNGNLKEASGIWTPAAELKNGRSAMIGIAAWLALEQHAGMPMTNVTWEIFSKAHGL
ncbi:MAG: hypothetical protein WDW38_009026 [Sanguina aurantia]